MWVFLQNSKAMPPGSLHKIIHALCQLIVLLSWIIIFQASQWELEVVQATSQIELNV